jgi:phage protein D
VAVTHLDQTRESDAAFLKRLGKKYDATATVKNDTLLFIPKNQSTTTSGKQLSTIYLTRAQGDNHRFHSAERDSYTGVRAFWHDINSALRQSVVAGSEENSKRLRTTYAIEADARQAAIAEWQRIQRGTATFELTLALGNPALMPTSPVKITGFKSTIDNVDWQATKVVHRISKNGFTSRIEMETQTEN